MILAGEERSQGRAFAARRVSGRSAAEGLDGDRSRPYGALPGKGKIKDYPPSAIESCFPDRV